MFLPVDDNSGDLLVEEDEDGGKECGNPSEQGQPPICDRHRVYQPRPAIKRDGLQ